MGGLFDSIFSGLKMVVDPFGSISGALNRGSSTSHNSGVLFPDYLPQNVAPYTPSSSGGGFSDWLASLPTPQQAVPMSANLQKTGVGPNQIPALWQNFAPFAAGMINQGAAAQRSAAISGASTARRDFEKQLLGAYQGQGVNPLFARAQLAESRPQAGYQLNTALGGIENNRLSQLLGLQGGIQNALAQAMASERQMNVDAYAQQKGYQLAQHAANSAQTSALLGLLGGAAGSIFGGPAGGAAGAALGRTLPGAF